MAELSESENQDKNSLIPGLFFLLLIITGVLMSFFTDPENDIQRFCFAVIISLAAGLCATYLTGKITGGGKLGFVNVKSATGGFFVWMATLLLFLYFFPKPEKERVAKIAGQWTYICTGHNSNYQHGGRFIALQNDYHWTLNGERMWRDTFNHSMNRWDCSIYNPTKSWHSVCGYVDNDQIRFEYIIENVNGEDIHGYAKGDITINDKNEIVKIKGVFNQLYPSKQISGDIEFIRVSDIEFENPHWNKNHECGD